MSHESDRSVAVLRNQRAATRYQILAEIAENQPAISQREIADTIGVTSQAVSEYLSELIDAGYVSKEGRGRYEITKEGVDWLLSATESLESYLTHVTEDVLGTADLEAAIATAPIDQGDRVAVWMEEGLLHAAPDPNRNDVTAVAVTDAIDGQEVGIAEFEGVLEYDLGAVTVLAVPAVNAGGSTAVDVDQLETLAADADLVAAAGVEAEVALRRVDLTPTLRFGTAVGVQEAAARGLDVLLVATSSRIGEHTERLREHNIGYDLIEAEDA